ncbi:MAG: hypothetical protein KCHDKBKB_00628 [Elusimicrobia bacterium]|nr:hypothetical protein [Elusimicrobiota bacterium]
MRKLASVQKIIDIKPIEGADAIEVATVLGWHVVVKKGEFKPGDLCVYYEVDSFLPADDFRYEFLKKNGTKKMLIDGAEEEGIRLRTIRLRGQISQGLCLPITVIHQSLGRDFLQEGDDVTGILGVHKYEPPMPAQLAGVAKGLFPSFIPKTDEPRIQGCPEILERYQTDTFYITEKVDGSSVTIYWKDGELNVCSRSINLLESEGNSFWKVANELGLKEKLKDSRWALQGELIGEGIQANRLKLKGQRILFYNVYDMQTGEYVSSPTLADILIDLGLKSVPWVDPMFKLPSTVDELVALATRKSKLNPEVWAEGIVIRPVLETRDPDLGRLSFKCINPEYLLKHGE